MKVAVSVPDPVFHAAERLARERGIPRSQVFTQALEAYLAQHGSGAITAQLDRVHGIEPAKLDDALAQAQSAALADETW